MTVDGEDGLDGINGNDGKDGLDIVWKGDLSTAPADPVKTGCIVTLTTGVSTSITAQLGN